MYIYRNVPFEVIWRFGWKNILFFIIYGTCLSLLHHYLLEVYQFKMHIPFSLIGPIGVAVAIYASFKNGQSYDRTWEARKNWGALCTASRGVAAQAKMFLGLSTPEDMKAFIDRQIAFLNAHKLQLRKGAPHSRKYSKSIRKYYQGEPGDEDWNREVASKLGAAEYSEIRGMSNKALQILFLQNSHIQRMYASKHIDEFKVMEMMRGIQTCMEHQGKNERIKSTPFPRQYGFFSKSFMVIFILILPFGILDFYKSYNLVSYIVIVFLYTLVAWLYITIELVGTNSEDPFENFITDIPMSALCRNVEIDLYEMLRETEIPEKVSAQNGVLM